MSEMVACIGSSTGLRDFETKTTEITHVRGSEPIVERVEVAEHAN